MPSSATRSRSRCRRATGTRSATVEPRHGPELVEELADRLSVFDDDVLRSYAEGPRPPTESDLLAALARATATGRAHPVFFGAALTGAGVGDLLGALPAYLPPAGGSPDEPLHATVFKIETDATGHPAAFVRVRSGRLSSRDDVERHHRERDGTVVAVCARAQRVATFAAGATTTDTPAVAGDIATGDRPPRRGDRGPARPAGTRRTAPGSSRRPGSSPWSSPATLPTAHGCTTPCGGSVPRTRSSTRASTGPTTS